MSADDRTGALEVAAEIAATAGAVRVGVGGWVGDSLADAGGVVDLGSRHLAPHEAIERILSLPDAGWTAHKFDSTLRGNWAHELRARHERTGRRVLVVAGWPAMGRTCVDGVVQVHGVPVGAIADELPEADLLADVVELRRWLEGDSRFAAVDVLDEASIHATARAVAGTSVLVGGPAGPVGAAFAAHSAARSGRPRSGRPRVQTVEHCHLPALVVCGSATDLSREQVRRLQAVNQGVDTLEAPHTEGDLVPEVALELAGRARARLALTTYRTLVLIGGETAAAVLGDGVRVVGGTVAAGMPWSRDALGEGPLVVTKAGGFGRPDALVRLFTDTTFTDTTFTDETG